MKNLFLICCFFYVQNIYAKSKKQELLQLNKYWQVFNPNIPELDGNKAFKNEVEKITTHLLYVEQTLRKRANHFNASQIKKRNSCLDILHDYALQAKFPQNTFHPNKRVPYFIDVYNTPCAVGHLIIETGFSTLAQKIKKENNYGYLADLKNQYPIINTWAKENGFTTDELAWIQPTYFLCTFQATDTINFGDSLFIKHPTCQGKDDGLIILDSNAYPNLIKPLTAVFTADINTAGITTLVPNGSFYEGTYSINISDAFGGNASTIITLKSAPYMSPNLSFVPSTCNGYNGSISVNNVNGGVPPYTYGLDSNFPFNCTSVNFPTSSNFQFNNINTGTYKLIIKDGLNCVFDTLFNTPGSFFAASSKILIPNTCTNNLATVQIQKDNFSLFNLISTYDTITLSAGAHTITASNNLGCTTTLNINIPTNYWDAVITAPNAINCFGDSAQITVGINALANTYLFLPFTNLGTFNVGAGIHQYIVTDAFGCSETVSKTYVWPPKLNATVANSIIKCPGSLSTLTVNINGGAPNYQSNYFTGSSVAPGTYTLNVTDAKACNISQTFVVTSPLPISTNASYNPISCNGDSTLINYSTLGGVAPYNYNPYLGSTIYAGTYTVTTLDGNNCTATTVLSITQPAPLNLQISSTPIICHGDSTSVTYNATGGTLPYTFSPSFASLYQAGSYIINTFDANGCTFTLNATITQSAPIYIDSFTYSYNGNNLIVTGNPITTSGLQNIQFQKLDNGLWTYINDTNKFIATFNTAGTYKAVITDLNGCNYDTVFIWNGVTGLNNFGTKATILPNPFSSSLTINNIPQYLLGSSLQIINTLGSLVYTQKIRSTQLLIETNKLVSGIYFVKIGNQIQVLKKE